MAKAKRTAAAGATRPSAKKKTHQRGRAARPAKVKSRARKTQRAAAPAARSTPRRVPFFRISAFTSRVNHGNPAGVVVLAAFPADDVMQAIAAEVNLSETAFVTQAGRDRWNIRWFTPTTEVELCGHATLAAAHALWVHLRSSGPKLVFRSHSGDLGVTRDGDRLVLDLPARPASDSVDEHLAGDLGAALGRSPSEVYRSGHDVLAVFENKRDVHELAPNFSALIELAVDVIATAPGAGHDFVSRYFGPCIGIPEDPVTGAAHCVLTPYWAARLSKSKLTAHQVSKRGGELECELKGDRVLLAGRAVTFIEGTITLPA